MPELDFCGDNPVPAPHLRARHRRRRKFLLQSFHLLFQPLPAGGLTLGGNGRAHLAGIGAGGKITVGFFPIDFVRFADNDHLAIKRLPEHGERHLGVGRDFFPFAAVVVGKEGETATLDTFKQHHPGRGLAVSAHGGKRHGIGQRQSGFNGFIHPETRLLQWIVMEGDLGQPFSVIFFAHIFHYFPGWLSY